MQSLKVMLILTFSVSTFSFFTFCISDEPSGIRPSDTTGEDSFMTALIDGVGFSSFNKVTVGALIGVDDVYQLSGAEESSDNIAVQLHLPTATATGTFTTMDNEVNLVYVQISPFDNWGAHESLASGTVTISENNATYMMGTFSFTGVNAIDNTTIEIIQGKFKAKKI